MCAHRSSEHLVFLHDPISTGHQKIRLDGSGGQHLALHAAGEVRPLKVCPFPADSDRAFLMKVVGFLLLVAGWLLVLAALEKLAAATPRAFFVIAGFAIEVLGLVLVFRSHLAVAEVES